MNVPGPGSTESLATPVTVSRSREGRSLASLGYVNHTLWQGRQPVLRRWEATQEKKVNPRVTLG